MDTRYQERTRGVTLTLLDLDNMIEELTPKIRAAKAARDVENADQLTVKVNWAPYGIAEGHDRLYVVNNEGVIAMLGPDDQYGFDIYVSSPGHIAILPEFRVNMTPDEIRAMATGDPIDLADLIRTFGPRLEDNFRICYDAITGRH